MVGASKILTVSYGTFSCTLEGFDDPFSTMKSIAEYFRDLAAEDRYFGAEPPTPDAEMLHRIAEREVKRRVEARISDHGVVLRQTETAPAPAEADEPEDLGTPDFEPAPPAAAPVMAPAKAAAPEPTRDAGEDSVAAKLSRIRAVVERARAAAPVAVTSPEIAEYEDFAEDQNAVAADENDHLRVAEAVRSALAEPEAPEAYEPITAQVDETTEPLAPELAEPASHAFEEPVAEEVAPQTETFAEAEAEVEAVVEAESDSEAEEQVVAEFEADLETAFEDEAPAAAEVDAEDEAVPVTFETEEPTVAEAPESLVDERDLESQAEEPAPIVDEDAMAHRWAEDAEVVVAEDAAVTEDEAETSDAVETEEEVSFAEEDEEVAADGEDEDEVVSEDENDLVAEQIDEAVAEEEVEPVAAEAVDDDSEEALAEAVADESATATEEPATVEGRAEPEVDATDEDDRLDGLAARIVKLKRAELEQGLLSDEDEDNVPSDPTEMTAGLGLTQDTQKEETKAEKADAKLERRTALIAGDPDKEPAFDRILEETNTKMAESEGTRRRSAIAHLKAAVAATKADRLLGRKRSSEDDAEEQSAYREDLAKVVRPRRSEPAENVADKAAEKAMAPVLDKRAERPRPLDTSAAPLVLVSSQRIDEAAETASQYEGVRPRRIGAGMLALETDDRDDDDDDRDFIAFAESMGARDLADLLEAAAAYTSFVERQPTFSRPQIMRRAAAIETEEEFTREAGLRSFGQLLRQGRIRKLQRGQFTIAENTRFKPQARFAGE